MVFTINELKTKTILVKLIIHLIGLEFGLNKVEVWSLLYSNEYKLIMDKIEGVK